MKKLLILASLIAAVGTYAQGTLNFANKSTALGLDVYFTLDDQTVGNLMGGDAKLGNTYFAGLYLKQGDSFVPAVLLGSTGAAVTVSFITSSSTGPNGYFSNSNVAVTGAGLSSQIEVKIAAWPKTYTSYEAAVTGLAAQGILWNGLTPSFLVTTGGGGSPADKPGTMTNLELISSDQGKTFFTVTASVVPEPSIFALGLLGGAAMLLRRRS